MRSAESNEDYLLARIKRRQVVDGMTPCWEWQQSKNPDGYGMCWARARGFRHGISAHRFSYEVFVGAIPDGMHLDHLCRNPPCCNPEHLEAVTQQENLRRGWDARNGRRYSVYERGPGLWATALEVGSAGRRKRKIFSSKSRDTAIARMEQYIAENPHLAYASSDVSRDG